MRFKQTAVSPKGRNKYGEYLSSGNIAKRVIKTAYYGDTTNNDITGGDDGGGSTENPDDGNFVIDLTTRNYDFDGSLLPESSITKQVGVVGYKGRTKADTYIGDITVSSETENHAISGIPTSGMTITLDGNGTPDTKINITITSALTETTGILYIPISINLKTVPGDPLDDDITAWNSNSADCVTEIFEFEWRVLDFSGDLYYMDLTNEAATINCDKDGHILTGATRPTCQAIMYRGIGALTSDVSFSVSTPASQNVQGLSINQTTGDLTFGANFDFDGDDLEITVVGDYNSIQRGAIMTISKVKPGADGSPAVSYWLVLSANTVKVTNNVANPNVVTATAMMQIGQETPTAATGVSIYYGYDTAYPSTTYVSTGVTVIISHDYLSFVLKKGDVIVDGVETIPILFNGEDGTSPYRLDLSNDNASINCDSAWNILPAAYRPKCTAKLWQGTEAVTGVTYAISGASCSYSGVSINSSTGVITLGEGDSAEPFWFDKNYTAIEVNINAYLGQTLCAAAVYTISRSIAGVDGDDGRSITGVTEHYCLSNNGTTAPTTGWTTSIQTPTASLPYLWNYEEIEFSSGAAKSTDPVVIAYYTEDGKGISAITEYYAINDNTGIAPTTGWTTSMVVPTAGNPYLWNYEQITYTDGSTSSTDPVIIGIRGQKGDDGRSITGVTEYYCLSNSSTTAPTSGWTTTISNPTESLPFLWNYESINYNSGMPTTTDPVVIAYYTKDGKGISAITEYYAINNSSATTPTSWSTSMVVPTDQNRYLWNYETITYTDGSTTSTTAVIIGIKGEKGADGRSITGVTEYYALNNDSSTAPTSGWSTNITNPTSGTPFLWNYESIGYNTGNATTTTPVIIARYTVDGKGISSITEYYACNNSTVTAPTTWYTTVQVPTNSSPYLWNYEKITYTDGSTASTTAVIIGIKGVDGASGDPAVTYWLELDYTEVKVTTAGTYTPATITVTKKKQVGGNAPTTTTDGVIKYGYDTVLPGTTYSSGITTSSATNYITVHYVVDNVVRDNETILILYDGKDGQSIAGREGPAIRGPYEWEKRSERSGQKWCAGTGETGTEESQFLDVILKDGTYYYCKTTYVESGQQWSSVENNWVSSSTRFDFVAANLILANNARINFMSSNGFYLMDTAGTVTAGAQGGNGTVYWAGANEPGNASFKVNYDGSITAETGVFAGAVRTPFISVTELQPNEQISGTPGTFYIAQTTWKGVLAEAPTGATNGWCYKNSGNDTYYYYYSSAWRTMTVVSRKGYLADGHTYLVPGLTVHDPLSQGCILILPNPSEDLNGLCYHIVAPPNYATKTAGDVASISVMCANTSETMNVYAFGTALPDNNAEALAFYGGSIEIVCVKMTANSYGWVVIQATGGLDIHNSQNINFDPTATGSSKTLVCSVSPIVGYSTQGNFYSVSKLVADPQLPSTKDGDTIYFTRN